MLPTPIVDPEALRAARLRANLTQHEVARRIGVAGGERVSRWELGASEPRPAVLRRLADVIGVDVDVECSRFSGQVNLGCQLID